MQVHPEIPFSLLYKNNLSLIQNKKKAVKAGLSITILGRETKSSYASPSVSILIISLVHSNRQFQVPF